jgi:large repetitive protein
MGMKSMSTLRIRIAPIVRLACFSVALAALTTCDLFKTGLGSKIDVTAPTIDVTSLKNGDYINSARTLSGTAGDDVRVMGVDVAVYSGSTLVATLPATISGTAWSVVLDPAALFPSQESQADLTIRVTDDSGKATDRRLVLYFDTVKPTIGSLTPSMANLENADTFLSETVAFRGSVKDGFGVESLSFLAGGVERWDAACGTSSWTVYADTTTYSAGTGGVASLGGGVLKVPVTIAATDKAGNLSDPITGYFLVDQNRSAPWIAGPTSGFFSNPYSGTFTTILSPQEQLSLRVTDNDGIKLDSIEATISDPTGVVPDFTYTFSAADEGSTWTKLQEDGTRLLKADLFIALPSLAQLGSKGLGKYSFAIVVSDDVSQKASLPGKPAATATRSYSDVSLTISNAVPTVSMSSPANGDIIQALAASGAVDDGIGVSSVKVGIDGGTAVDATLASSGAGVSHSAWTFAPASALSEGTHDIAVYGLNIGSKQSAVTERQFVIDRTSPSLEILSVAPATTNASLRPSVFADVTSAGDPGGAYNKVNGIARVRVSATDLNPLASLTWELRSLDGSTVVSAQAAVSSWAVDIDTTPSGLNLADETKYRLVLTATDKAGNATSLTRTLWVSQSGDEPAFTLKNMTALASSGATASSNLMLSNPRIELSVMDDDWVDAGSISILVDQDPSDASPSWIALAGTRSSDGSVSASRGLSSLADGRHRFYLRASDTDINGTDGRKAGLSSASSTIGPVWFAIDLTPPAISFDGATEGLYVSSTKSLTGAVYSALALDGAAPLTFSFNGGAAASPGSLNPVASDSGSHSWGYDLDVGGVADGARSLLATAIDEFGVTSTRSLSVTVDKTAPELVVNEDAPYPYFSDVIGLSLIGTTRDLTSGVASMTATVMRGATDVSSQATLTLNAAAGTPNTLSNWSLNLANLATGDYAVSLRAVDKAGNARDVAAFTIYVDKDTPVASIANALGSPVAGAVYNEASAMPADWSGAVVETFFKSGTVTLDGTTIGTLSGSGAWTATNAWDSVGEGSHTLVVKVDDMGGHSATASATFVKDTIAPTLSVTTPEAGTWQSSTPLTIRGGVDDGAGTGVYKLYYLASAAAADHSADSAATIASTWTAASGTGSWSGTLDLSTLGEGARILWTAARDKAGNWTAISSTAFSVDLAAPRATMAAAGTFATIASVQSTRLDFTLSGTADDAQATSGRAAASSVLSYTKDGGTATNVTLTPAANGSWSWLSSSASLTNGSNDGLYVFTLTVTDVAGKVSSSQQIIKIDTTAPTLAIAAPVTGEATALSSYAISGTSRDTGGVGFDNAADVEYQFSTEGATWHSLSLSGTTWSASVALGAGEGSRTLKLRSTDALGNQSTASVSFYYDLANPTLTETAVGTTDTQYRNSDLAFGGAASDSNALASLAVSIDGGAAVPITVTAGAWAYSFDADSPTAEGAYTLVFTATDAANKTTSLTRYVVVDRTAATLSGITNLTLTWNASSGLAVSGSSSDGTGSGLSRVEYSTDGTNYSAFTGTASFSGTVAFADGAANVLRIRAVDKAGNLSVPAAGNLTLQTVRVDTIDPTLDIASPTTTPILSNTAPLNVSITAADATSGPATAQAKVGDSNFAAGTVYSASASSGSATIAVLDLSSLAEGTRRVYVRVVDGAGRASSPTAVNVLIDTTNPTVTFASHSNGSSVNKLVTFSGTSSDANGVASCAVQVYRHDTAAWVAAPSGAGSGTTSWSLASFDTAAITAASAIYDSDGNAGNGLQLRVRAHATDSAGNTADEERTLVVDQDGDKPVVKLSNLATTGTGVLKQTNVIYGTISDDDGALASFKIATAAVADWSAVAETPLDGNSFSYTVGGGDGTKTLYLRIQDAGGQVFLSESPESATTPRLYVSAGTYTGLPVAFRLDTANPDIGSTIKVDTTSNAFGAASSLIAGSVFGGSVTGTLYLRAEAYDANGILSVNATVSGKKAGANWSSTTSLGVNGAATPENAGYAVYQSSSGLSVAAFDDGTASIDIAVTDNSGLVTTSSKSIVIDNTAPSFSITSHTNGAVVNGDLALKGTASDSLSGLGAVYYKLGVSTGPGAWTAVTSASLYSWSIDFSDIDLYADNGTAGHYAGYSTDADSDGIFYFPIMIRAVDKAGNASTSVYGDFALQLDPGGDKPKVSIVYPYNPTEPLGGTVRVYGSATDDDGVYGVYMQIDCDGDGDFDASDTATADYDSNVATPDTTVDWYNGGLGRAVTGTNNWSQSINAAGEFNPTPAQIAANETRTIHARVRAMDTKNGTSGDIYGPWVETTIQLDSNVPKIGSSQALYLYQGPSGSPTATKVYTSGMYVTGSWTIGGSVEDEGGISNIVVSGGLSANLGTGVNASWFSRHTVGSDLRYDLAIPVTTAANSSGTISFTVTAYDNTSRVSTCDVKVFYDNIAPTATFTSFDSSTKIVQSDGYYKVGGTAIDDGSDIQKILVYFIRRSLSSSSLDRFIRPDLSSSNTAYVTGTDKLGTLNSGGGSVTVDFPTDANFLINVDHKGYAESHIDTSNNDTDNYVEKLKQTSGDTYSWYADILSSYIPDGPLEIHFVVYDESGNTRHYVYSGTVENNGPSVSSISLGTDLDENGTVASSEKTGYATPTASTSTSFVVKAAPMTLDIGLAGGNNDVYYSLAHGATTLRPLVTNAGSFVVGATYTVASVGTTSFTAIGAGSNAVGVSFVASGAGSGSGTAYPTLRSTGTGSPVTITLTAAEVAAVGDGSRTFTITAWDCTEETVPGTNSLSVAKSIACTLKVNDVTPPMAVLGTFYWSSSGPNSLYDNSTANGHIELNGVVDGADPDVSGKVKVQGTGYDDQMIRRIYARIDGLTLSAVLSSANTTTETFTMGSAHGLAVGDIVYFGATGLPGGLTANVPYYVLTVPTSTTFTVTSTYSGSAAVDVTSSSSTVTVTGYRRMATYSSGSWAPVADTLAANGWDFSVANTALDQTGHQVAWTLDWDSSKIATVAATNAHIKVLAMDKAGNLSSTTANSTADVTTNNVPDYQVDVVPYIKSISRSGAYSTIRSKEGRYVLSRGETITIAGFNLINSTNSVTIGGAAATISGTTTSVTTTVPATASSGAITYSVNGVGMPNNLNTNSLAYNNEATASSAFDGSALWNDDRKVHIWISDSNQATGNYGYFAGSGFPVYPAMTYNGSGTLYASWSNYSAASVYYGNNMNATVSTVVAAMDPSEHTDIAWAAGNTSPDVVYNANWRFSTNTGEADFGGLQMYTQGAPQIINKNPLSGTRYGYILEELYHDQLLMQFVNPRVVGSNAAGHFVSYYDTDTKSMKFAYVAQGATSQAEITPWVNIDGGGDFHDSVFAGGSVTTQVFSGTSSTVNGLSVSNGDAVVSGTTTLFTTAAGGNIKASASGYVTLLVGVGNTVTNASTRVAVITPTKRATAAGEYSAIALTNGHPIIAYYDTTNQTVKVAHCAGTGAGTTTGSNWTVQTAMSVGDPCYQYSGKHISAKIDGSGFLHLVFYRTSTGDLVYLKSTNSPTDGSTDYTFGSAVIVDSIGSVGTGADLTLSGTTPYISYYDASNFDSFNGLKMAYYDSAVSDWEYMNAPLAFNVANDNRTSIEYNTGVTLAANQASNSNTAWAAAIGYRSDDYFRVGYYVYGN